MNARFASLVVLGVTLCAGCKDEERPAPRPTAVAPPRAAVLGPRAIASRVAYDLVLAGEGAILVWGPPSDQGGGVSAARMDSLGTRSGAEVRAYDPPREADRTLAPIALELSAAVAGGKIAALWVERDELELPVRAVVGDAATLSFGEATTLAEGLVRGMNYRGHVALAGADDGSFVGIHRGVDRPCEEGGATACAGFSVRPIGAGAAGEARVPLAVPSPCQRSIAGIVAPGGRLYYGVCSEAEDRMATTVYTIQRDPEHARSDRVLEGCAPVGVTLVSNAAWVVGDCGERRRVARFEPGADVPIVIDAPGGAIRCEDDHPVIPIANGVEIPLEAPMDRLDALLPPTLTQLGARAVWTGEAMLLAVSLGREVAVHRYQCESGQFVRTDLF